MVLPLCNDYQYPYDAFKLLATGTDIYGAYDDYDINQEYVESLIQILKQQMTIHPVKIIALVDITCFVGGVNAIKNSLTIAQNSAPKEFNINIQYHGTPTFLIHTTTTDEENGIIVINNVVNCIKEEIIKYNGEFKIKKEAHVLIH